MRLASVLSVLWFGGWLAASQGVLVAAEASGHLPVVLEARHTASIPCIDPDTGLRFSPLGLASGLTGALHVVDGDNSRIFTVSDSASVLVFFADCPEALAGCEMVDLAADGGWFYFSDRANGLVAALDSRGGLLSTAEAGPGIGGIGLGSAGQIYAAMTIEGSVLITDLYGGRSPIVCELPGGPEGSYPVDCLVGKSERVLVTDAFSRAVIILGAFGKYLGKLEGFDFGSPYGICAYGDDAVLVSDMELGLVVIFDGAGRLLGTFGHDELVAPGFIEAGDDGTVWVADPGKMTIEVYKLEAAHEVRQ
jgi:hypothetical protein